MIPRLNIAVKVALASVLAPALIWPSLPQYQDKAMGYRLVLYPLVAALAAIVTFVRRRSDPDVIHPHLVDLLVTLPFLLDAAGNAADLYDTVWWWDDAMHVVTWIPLVAAAGLVLTSPMYDRMAAFAIALGAGAVLHILWELAEYATFVQSNPTEAMSAYRDTMGDFAASLVGSLVGACFVARARGAARVVAA